MATGFDAKQAEWLFNGSTTDDPGTGTHLIETGTTGVHLIYQDTQSKVDNGLGRSVVMQARIIPEGRTKCWLGARQNNGNFQADFDLSGAGATLARGPQVTSSSIEFNAGDGSYLCTAVFSGSYSESSSVFGIGALITEGQQSYAGTASLLALRIIEAQLTQGTSVRPYTPTDDRSSYLDQATADGSQNFDVPGTNLPERFHPDYTKFEGGNGYQTPADYAYDLDDFTVQFLCTWDGDPALAKVLGGHWDGGTDNGWLAILDTDGKFQVWLSGNGSTTHKTYTSDAALDIGVLFLLTFTWDGTTLRLYINDVELTVAAGELVKTTDLALSGNIHDSSSQPAIFDAFHGNGWHFYHYNGAATPTDVLGIAGGLGLSGLPGGGPPTGGGGGNLPATLAEMKAHITAEYGITNFVYVDNGASGSNNGTESDPWTDLQSALDVTTGGNAIIVSGSNGRFFDSYTPMHSGTSGNPIVIAGNPEEPFIVDGSEAFSPSWTSEGNDVYSAPYSKSFHWNPSDAYGGFGAGSGACTASHCVPIGIYQAHAAYYDDKMLKRIVKHPMTSAPASSSFNEGEVFFRTTGTSIDNWETADRIYVKLPGSVNPASNPIRLSRGEHTLFDFSDKIWGRNNQNLPGGTGTDKKSGRAHITMLNAHFKFGAPGRLIGAVVARENNWEFEWCSISDCNQDGLTLHGHSHTFRNCKFMRLGKGIRASWLHDTNAGETLFDKCLFLEINSLGFPNGWDAAIKFTDDVGSDGTIRFTDCLFKDIDGSGYWTDINCGRQNPIQQAHVFQRCIFELNARHAVFMENNSFYHILEDCGIWETDFSEDGASQQHLASGVRIAGSGWNTIRRCAIVYNKGKGVYNKVNSDCRASAHGGNNNTIVDTVFVNNGRDTAIDIKRVNHLGGNDCSSNGDAWNTSTIQGNVYCNQLGEAQFSRENSGSFTNTDSLTTFESSTWTGGSGNIIDNTPGNVVENYLDRKSFWNTKHAGGLYPTKGPTGLVHYEDIPETQWSVAGLTLE